MSCGCPCSVQGVGQMAFRDPFLLKQFCDSVILGVDGMDSWGAAKSSRPIPAGSCTTFPIHSPAALATRLPSYVETFHVPHCWILVSLHKVKSCLQETVLCRIRGGRRKHGSQDRGFGDSMQCQQGRIASLHFGEALGQ